MGKNNTIKQTIIATGQATYPCSFHNFFGKKCSNIPDVEAVPSSNATTIMKDNNTEIFFDETTFLALKVLDLVLEHADTWIEIETAIRQMALYDIILGVFIIQNQDTPSDAQLKQSINAHLSGREAKIGFMNADTGKLRFCNSNTCYNLIPLLSHLLG